MTRLVVGFGNVFRRDDGAGHLVVERIGPPAAIAVRDGAVEIVEQLAAHDEVVLVDAVMSGAEAGTIHRFREGQVYPRSWGGSSHSIGLVEVVELARALGTLPEHVSVIGIEAGDTTAGRGLSAPVEAAVERLVEELADA